MIETANRIPMHMEIQHTLCDAAREIKSLRRRNEILEAQMYVVHIFNRATAGVQDNSRGMSEDIAWKCEKLAEEISIPKESDNQ